MFLFPCFVSAQNNVYVINESFDEISLPTGWLSMGNGINNWYISQSNISGGKPNEARLSWSPPFNGISRLVSPPVDLTDVSSAVLALKHYPSFFGVNQAIVGVATSSDNGTTWNSVWSEQYNTNGQYSISEAIGGPDMGKSNVMFCIYFEGNSSAISDWYFDDFEIYTIEDLNVELTSIDVPSFLHHGKHDISFTIKNSGNSAIQSVKARYTINESSIEQTFFDEVTSMNYKQFTFNNDFTFNPNEKYNLTIEIINVNDNTDDATDNVLSKEITSALSSTQMIPMIEHFSSSTCSPCVFVNNSMSILTGNHEGQYTYTKYTSNGPALGDPYYTEEGGTRMSYYNVIGVPQIFLNGADQGYSSVTEENFANSYDEPAFANVRGAFNVEGNNINITADFMSYFDMNDIRAFVTVNEKTTTGNASSNGETEFHHVMMKMLENAEGNIMNINAGEYQRLEFSYDMSSTNVEEMNDLEVSLWLQNIETKQIFNSHFAYEYTEHCYPVQNFKALLNNENNTLNLNWEAPEHGNPTGYNIYIDSELIKENHQGNTFDDFTINDNKTHIAEVVAVYEDGKTSVGAAKIIEIWNDVIENDDTSFNIYPNPTKDIVKISTVGSLSSVVRIYNVMGMTVEEIKVNSNNMEINIADYTPGIYFFNIEGKTVKVIKD